MAYRRGDKPLAFSASFLPSRAMYRITLLLVRLADWFLFRLRVKGKENLSRAGPALLVSNHTLVVDPGIIAHAIRPYRSYYTMLEETACIPLLGTFVRLLGAIPIPRHLSGLRTLEGAIRGALRDLRFVHFFPEGECCLWNQQLKPFQPGVFYLACRLDLPLLPVTIVLHEQRWFGCRAFRLAGRTLRVPPRVTVVIGRPLEPDPAAGRQQLQPGASLRRRAALLAARTGRIMQRTIDREGGSKTICKGMMPRLAAQGRSRPEALPAGRAGREARPAARAALPAGDDPSRRLAQPAGSR